MQGLTREGADRVRPATRFALRPLEIKHLFDFSIRLYRANFRPMFLTLALAQLPLTIGGTVFLFLFVQAVTEMQTVLETGETGAQMFDSFLAAAPTLIGIAIFYLIYQLVVMPLAHLCTSKLALQSALEEPWPLAAAFEFAKRHYWPTQAALALFALPLLLLSMLLLLPVLFLSTAGDDTAVLGMSFLALFLIGIGGFCNMLLYFRVFPALVGAVQALEQAPPGNMVEQGLWYLKRAWNLSGSHFWRMLGLLLLLSFALDTIRRGMSESVNLVVLLGTGVAGGLSGSEEWLTHFSTTDMTATMISLMASAMLGMVLPPVVLCYQNLLYLDLRCRTEGLDLLRLLDGEKK
jgi:hypothetical protein